MANVKYDFRNMKIGDKIIVDYRGRNAAYVFRYYNPDFKFRSRTEGEQFILERIECGDSKFREALDALAEGRVQRLEAEKAELVEVLNKAVIWDCTDAPWKGCAIKLLQKHK